MTKWPVVHTGMTIERLAEEAFGFCESGLPFELCIDGPCVCPLTRKTVAQYVRDIGQDLAIIKKAREEYDALGSDRHDR